MVGFFNLVLVQGGRRFLKLFQSLFDRTKPLRPGPAGFGPRIPEIKGPEYSNKPIDDCGRVGLESYENQNALQVA